MTDLPDEASLVARARAKDTEAFGLLVGRYERPLESILRPYARDMGDARDLVQEAILRAYRNLHLYREDYRFSTWFFRIGINLAISARRRHGYDVKARDPSNPDSVARDVKEPVSPLEELLAAEDREKLAAALAALPDRWREIMRLRYADELPCQEIASRLGVTPNTVSIVLFRAKQRLREQLGAPEGEPEA